MFGWLKTLACCGAVAVAMPVHANNDFSISPISVTDFGGGLYGFSHGGWSGGGMVTGSFTGFDNDNNGQLSSFVNEITNFSMTFSGSGTVPAFSIGYIDFYGLIYTLDGGMLGDTVRENPEYTAEGIWAFGVPGVYIAGPAVLSVCDGALYCAIIGATDDQFVESTAVPEPSTWTLLIAGFGLTGTALRRRGIYRAA